MNVLSPSTQPNLSNRGAETGRGDPRVSPNSTNDENDVPYESSICFRCARAYYTDLSAVCLSLTYEALKDVTKRDYLLQRYEESKVVAFGMLEFFKELWEDFFSDSVAMGLTRLHSNGTPPPPFGGFSLRNKTDLVEIWRLCADLRQQRGGSSIASAATDGTLYSVGIEFDKTDELAAMRVAMTPALDFGDWLWLGDTRHVTPRNY